MITGRSRKFLLWELGTGIQDPYTQDPDFTPRVCCQQLCGSGHFIYPPFAFPCIKLWMTIVFAKPSAVLEQNAAHKCLLLSLVSHWWPVCSLHSWVQSDCMGSVVPCISVCARLCLLGNACLRSSSAACAQLYAAVTSSLEETASSVTFPCTLSNTYADAGCGWLSGMHI